MSKPTRTAGLSRRAALAAIFAAGLYCATTGRVRAAAPPEAAQAAPASPVAWSKLSAEEQKMLQRFGDRWDTLPAERQQRLLRGTRRWLNMTPEQRQHAQERFARWKDLTPEQRDHARRAWRRYQDLGPDQKARVRDGYHRFKKLSPEQRRRLRERWENATPEERQKWLERRRQRQERRGD